MLCPEDAGSDVIAHNVETVERHQWPVRNRQTSYEQSLSVLGQLVDTDAYSKTSQCWILESTTTRYTRRSQTPGRWVPISLRTDKPQPSRQYSEVIEYVHPNRFETWRRIAEATSVSSPVLAAAVPVLVSN